MHARHKRDRRCARVVLSDKEIEYKFYSGVDIPSNVNHSRVLEDISVHVCWRARAAVLKRRFP